MSRPPSRRDRGMTLIELMIAVVVVGVLATVAVIAYNRYVRPAKSRSEVVQVFQILKAREDAHHNEFGSYLDTTAFFPTAIGRDPVAASPLPAEWESLKANPGKGALLCQYRVIAGTAGSNAAMEATGLDMFGATAPNTSWYYVLAQCDTDGDGVYAVYAMRGDRTDLVVQNEGE